MAEFAVADKQEPKADPAAKGTADNAVNSDAGNAAKPQHTPEEPGEKENKKKGVLSKIFRQRTFEEYLAAAFAAEASQFHFAFKDPKTEEIIEDYYELLQRFERISNFSFTGLSMMSKAAQELHIRLPQPAGGQGIIISVNKQSVHGALPKNPEKALSQALQMALIARANPLMMQKGIRLNGSAQEQAYLYLAATKLGFADRIKNPPANAADLLAAHGDALDSVWEELRLRIKNPQERAEPKIKKEAAFNVDNLAGSAGAAEPAEAAPSAPETGAAGEREVPAEVTPEMRQFLKTYIMLESGVELTDAQMEPLIDGLTDDNKINIVQALKDGTDKKFAEELAKLKAEAEPVETAATPAIVSALREAITSQRGLLQGTTDLTDEQVAACWEWRLSEKERKDFKLQVEPPAEAVTFITKQFLVQNKVTLTQDQALKVWQSYPPQLRPIIGAQAGSEETQKKLDKSIAALKIPAQAESAAPAGITGFLRAHLEETLKLDGVTDEQVAELWKNTGGNPNPPTALDAFDTRELDVAVNETLQSARIDEDTYREVTRHVVETGDARAAALKNTFNGLSAGKVRTILKAMDAEGITRQDAPGKPRTVVVNLGPSTSAP